MSFCDVVDQLLNQHGFTYTGSPEQSNFTSFGVRLDQINDFNSCKQYFCRYRQVFKSRCISVDRHPVGTVFWQSFQSVNRISVYIEQTSVDVVSYRDLNRISSSNGVHTSAQSICRIHRDTANRIFSNVLFNFQNQKRTVVSCNFQRVENLWKTFTCSKCDINYGSNNLSNFTC